MWRSPNQYNRPIPYEQITYGHLTSRIQQVAIKICKQDRTFKQLAKESAQGRKHLGLFCEQFGLLPCSTRSYKRPKHKIENPIDFRSKPKSGLDKPKQKYDIKFTSKNFKSFTPNQFKTTICFKCKKPGHIARYDKMWKRIQELFLDEETSNKIQIFF